MLAPFEDVVEEHGPTVMRVCRALLGPHDAEDAWSETFLSALRAYPGLRPESNLRGWLVTIAHRKAIDHLRRARRTPLPLGIPLEDPRAVGRPGETDGPGGPDDGLRAALQALAPKQRSAVVYHYLADLPYAEVAALLDTSEAAARRSAADGIARLRRSYRRPAVEA